MVRERAGTMSYVELSHEMGVPAFEGRAMPLSIATLASVVLAGLCVEGASGALIAGWNMNGVDPAVASTMVASTGTGILDFNAFGGNAGILLGTTMGALEGEAAGDSLSITNSNFNGVGMTFAFDATGYRDLALSFAVRRSATGFASNRIDWWNGTDWSPMGSFGASSTTWDLRTFDFASTAAANDRYAIFRIVIDGATSTSGSIRFDNVQFTGTAVPAHGALALLGFAGIIARRRR